MSGFLPPTKAWKPRTCTDCGKRHPTFNRDGGKGVWRCRSCDATASPAPDPIASTVGDEPAQPSLL